MTAELMHTITILSIHTQRPSGWAAVRGRVQQSDAYAIGSVLELRGVWPALREGASYTLTLRHTPHPRFGDQYQVDDVIPAAPSSRDTLVAYLQTFDGIGEKRAEAICDTFGDTLESVLNRTDAAQQLRQRVKLSKVIATALVEQWHAHAADRTAQRRLIACGASPATCIAASAHFGSRLLEVLEDAPYSLMEVRGIGFATADRIAQGCGIADDSPQRLWAALTHVVQAATAEGHCFTPQDDAVRAAAHLVQQPPDTFAALLQPLPRSRDQLWPDRQGRLWVRALRNAERRVAKVIATLQSQSSAIVRACAQVDWAATGATLDVALSDEQLAAVQLVLRHPVAVLTGGPGTGKSTIVRAVLAAVAAAGIGDIALCAPTGKAARRLSETTGQNATTIHRLLGWTEAGPSYDATNPLPARMVIVDEASMLDLLLADRLLAALAPTTHLLLVGDVDQLPSVGPGRVLADLIAGGIPTARLGTIYRQAAQSLIVRAAHDIRQGAVPDLANRLDQDDCFCFDVRDPQTIVAQVIDLVTQRIPQRFGLAPETIRVLAPQYKGPCGIDVLNTALQAALNPPDDRKRECAWRDGVLRVGDRLVWTRNVERHDLINGEEVWVHDLDTDAGRTTVRLVTEDGRMLDLPLHELDAQPGYCLSVHKSQGSEYAAAIVVCDAAYPRLVTRRLVYTALTRAKRLGVIMGGRARLAAAIARDDETQRRTTLAERVAPKRMRERAADVPATRES